MVARFNPPEGWPPPPPGWLPPAGWTPDPTLPPAPDGWRWVIDDATEPLPAVAPGPVDVVVPPPPASAPGPVPGPVAPAQFAPPGQYGVNGVPPVAPRTVRRWPIATATGVVGLVLGLVIGSALGGGDSTTKAEPTASVTKPAAEETSEQPSSPTPTEEPVVDDEGTRTNPFAVGTPFGNEDWTVVLGPTVQNANDLVAAENLYNDPPVAGRQFVMVPVTVTYTGATSGTPWVELSFDFVGSAGNTFGTAMDDYCGVVPGDLTNVGELHPDGVGTGNVCVSVPSEQVAGGVWAVSTMFSDPVFGALQ